CLKTRLVVLPLERTIAAVERDSALEMCGAAAIVENIETKISLRLGAPASCRPFVDEGRQDAGAPSLLKLTSGTTAAPRAIRFRSAQLLADCENICDTMGISQRDLNFGVIPISHSYGFRNRLSPFIACGFSVLPLTDRFP